MLLFYLYLYLYLYLYFIMFLLFQLGLKPKSNLRPIIHFLGPIFVKPEASQAQAIGSPVSAKRAKPISTQSRPSPAAFTLAFPFPLLFCATPACLLTALQQGYFNSRQSMLPPGRRRLHPFSS